MNKTNILALRLKTCREQARLSQKGLADATNGAVTQAQVSKIEKGDSDTTTFVLKKLSHALNVSPLYLMGETDTPVPAPAPATVQETKTTRSAQGITLPPKPNASYIATTAVPLVSRDFPACCGNGNGYYDVDTYAEGTVFVKSSSLRFYDETRPPFAVRVEGDSMEEAGITEDCAVVVNPADEVRSGDTAFVVWNDNWFIKWVIWDRDGSVTLKSSNPSYQPIHIDKELAQDESWFRVIGKVVAIVREDKPRGAF